MPGPGPLARPHFKCCQLAPAAASVPQWRENVTENAAPAKLNRDLNGPSRSCEYTRAHSLAGWAPILAPLHRGHHYYNQGPGFKISKFQFNLDENSTCFKTPRRPSTSTRLEGTSEASLAASVPRVSTDALPTQEPGPGPGRTHSGLQGWNRDGGSNKRFVHST